MKTVSIRELQHHFSDLIPHLEEGGEIAVRNRKKIFAKLIPWGDKSRKRKWPDFKKRLREDFSEVACIKTAELINASRGER